MSTRINITLSGLDQAIDRRVQTLEAEQAEAERRLSRLER